MVRLFPTSVEIAALDALLTKLVRIKADQPA